MVQQWNSGAYDPGEIDHDADVLFAELIGGVKSALTFYAGSSDPSSGAPTAWDSPEVGTEWKDTTDADNIVRKQWQQLTTGPTTYGWRTMRLQKTLWPTSRQSVIAAATTAADLAYANQSLAAILDAGPGNVQDAGQLRPRVRSVTLIIRTRFTTSTHPATDTLFVKVRPGQASANTNERKVYCPPTVNVWHEQEVEVQLDTSEVFQWGVDTNAGGNTVAYEIELKCAKEET
jgi:hypothetical protein